MQKELDLTKKLGFDEIIDHTLAVYKQDFRYYIKTMLYFFVPAIVIILYSMWKVYGDYASMIRALQGGPNTFFSGFWNIMVNSLAATLAYTAFSVYTGAAVIKGFDEKINGRKTPESEAAVFALKKTLPIFFTSLIAMIMMGFGFIFCVIPFFILAVYMAYIPQTIMLEDRVAFGSIGRSFSLASGNFWGTLLIPLIYFLAYTFFASIITYALMLTPYIELVKDIIGKQGQIDPSYLAGFYERSIYLFFIQTVLTNVLHVVMCPILNIALTLKFYNIRAMREGKLPAGSATV